MNDFQLFISFIETSLLRIQGEYFHTQYNQFYAIRHRLRPFGNYNGHRFVRHSERGFAYELYFHLRTLIDERRTNHEFFTDYFLQGEIKKMDVQEVLQIFGYQSLGGGLIPDLLFHIPSQDANAFVIEIKAQPELEEIEILYDLDKLSRFLRRFNYRKAVFIAVNIPSETITTAITNNRIVIQELFTEERLDDCNIIIKQDPTDDSPLFNQTLTQILA
jgi:hypothetical protein